MLDSLNPSTTYFQTKEEFNRTDLKIEILLFCVPRDKHFEKTIIGAEGNLCVSVFEIMSSLVIGSNSWDSWDEQFLLDALVNWLYKR